jgi:IS4 transposase
MVMMHDSLPDVHSFVRAPPLRASARLLLLRLLTAFCFHLGRMTAAQAAALPRSDPRHPAAIGRALGRKHWAKAAWLQPLRTLLLRPTPTPGTYFFLLDQTCSSRQGEKTPNTFSSGNRTRRPRRGRRYDNKKRAPKRCHAFVCGLLLTPDGRRIPYHKSYYTREYAQQQGLPYRTQAELGAALIAELEVPAQAQVVVLGDTAYEAAVVQQACAGRTFAWIAPCNAERVLAGSKPRRKVRHWMAELSAQRFFPIQVHPDRDPYAAQRRTSLSRRGRSNRGRTFWVCKQTLEIHSVGKVLVLVSTAHKPKAGGALVEPKILLCSDVTLSAREVVLRYTLRWQIELFFKELKGVLGMVDYRFRDFERVERWVEVVLATFLYLEWYRWGRVRQASGDERERLRWQAARSSGLCRAVRAEAERHEWVWLAERLRTPRGCQRARRLLRAVTPCEPCAGP